MKPNALVINEADDVAVALEDIPEGGYARLADGREIKALALIPFSHKIALRDIKRGEDIRKYGETIGQAGEDIRAGEWVHTHNLTVEEREG